MQHFRFRADEIPFSDDDDDDDGNGDGVSNKSQFILLMHSLIGLSVDIDFEFKFISGSAFDRVSCSAFRNVALVNSLVTGNLKE